MPKSEQTKPQGVAHVEHRSTGRFWDSSEATVVTNQGNSATKTGWSKDSAIQNAAKAALAKDK
jgi:hypothetical protein